MNDKEIPEKYDSSKSDDKLSDDLKQENGGKIENKQSNPIAYTIKIDRSEYKIFEKDLKDGTLTGAEIRKLPKEEIGQDRDIFEVVAGGPDRKIDNKDHVKIHDGLRIFSAPTHINPGGKSQSSVTNT